MVLDEMSPCHLVNLIKNHGKIRTYMKFSHMQCTDNTVLVVHGMCEIIYKYVSI